MASKTKEERRIKLYKHNKPSFSKKLRLMLELFFVRILRQQENLGLKKPNNCSYSFRLQVQQSGTKVSWQRGWKGCPDPNPNNCSPKPEPGHWAAGRLGVKRTIIPSFGGCRAGHWVRLYRTIIRFPDPGRSGPEQKNPEPLSSGPLSCTHPEQRGVQNSICFLTLGFFA